MFRKFVFLFLLLACSVGAVAQKPAPADLLENNLRKHVQYLASDQLEGRKTGEVGATTAAGYVANQFAQFKLKPGIKTAKGKGNFLQAFPYVSGVTIGDGSLLRLIPADATKESRLEPGITYTPFANSINGEVANAPLVFAGFGISTPDKRLDDYVGLDVNGKVVLAFNGIPEGNTLRSEFSGVSVQLLANIAKERGARAMVLIAQTEDFKTDPLTRFAYDPGFGETSIPVVIIDRSIAADLLGVKDFKEVNEIEKWLRMKGNAPPYIQIRPYNLPGATASMKVELNKKTVDAYNVIGIVEGNDPTLKNEAIVIGAHYDHLGRGGRSSMSPNSSDIHHGADDNASGTAAIIELARQFAKDKKNKRTLIFMAFGGEEEGLLGSKHYVANPVWPLDKTVAMINLDMVGRLNENKLSVGGIGTANEWKGTVESFALRPALTAEERTFRERIYEVLRLIGVNTVFAEYENGKATLRGSATPEKYADALQAVMETGVTSIDNRVRKASSDERLFEFQLQLNEDGLGPSDHASFYLKQIPVLFFFTGSHLDYHKPSDTAEKINYEGLTKITNYVAAIAKSIDETPTRPTYKVAQSSGMGGRAQFNVSLGTIPSYGETNDGLGIDGVRDNSPAAKAGLKGGDKIIKLAGKDVRNVSDYMFALGVMKAGEEYEVVVKRGTETLTMKIVPAPATRR